MSYPSEMIVWNNPIQASSPLLKSGQQDVDTPQDRKDLYSLSITPLNTTKK